MPSRGQTVTITYVAWDTSANGGKTGDVGNHTLRWVKDGTSAAPSNSPSEVDATNAPGVYKIVMTAGECTCNVGVLAGKSSTANVSIVPVAIPFEQLPTAAPDAAGGLPISDAGGLDMDALVSANVTVSPIAGTLAARFTSPLLTLIQYEDINYGPWVITDTDGVAVDLSGLALALVVYDLEGDATEQWRLTSGAGEITVGGVGNNQVTLTDDDTNTQTAGRWGYTLWDTTNSAPIQRGILAIERSAGPTAP